MPGLTLLNIERSNKTPSSSESDPLKEINQLIDEIYDFSKRFPGDTMSARLVPLKMKLKQLQDVVSQFGQDGTIQVNEKQEIIMQLHMELQMLTNALLKYKGPYSEYSEICSNYLLNHLSTTAAVDPRATVIGVSNTMAQVLSKDIQIIEDPEFKTSEFDPKFFENFSLKFNQMLTIAGLFSAPVLGLPDIPISQLGSWSDQALSQFAAIYRFIDLYYSPLKFYKLEKDMNANPFDTTADILSFYIYLNDFFAALIARADLLSGIEFPKEFTLDQKAIILQSTTQINEILANSIIINCDIINGHINDIYELYKRGAIDRNENPRDKIELRAYQNEVKIWRLIARFAQLMPVFFENKIKEYRLNPMKKEQMLQELGDEEDLPSITNNPRDAELELIYFMYAVQKYLTELYPAVSHHDVSDFITSSEFTKFRQFLQYLIHAVAVHDIFLNLDNLWTPWMNSKFGRFYLESTTAYNPVCAMEAGFLSIMLGIERTSEFLINDGVAMLKNAKQYLEFQLHNYFAISVILELVNIGPSNLKTAIEKIIQLVDKFLNDFQISPNSLLFQRANLYKGMLSIYKLTEENSADDPFLLMPTRPVSFDPFSWILVSNNYRPVFPYIPLNTSLANLNSA
ncbi:MAG: hypothetical protein INQ03_12115 [Candidatus Heimdallarchaeota archaeon]|nr:hypothetical protein [Candidatus Heimdallarchaeota archaeon]